MHYVSNKVILIELSQVDMTVREQDHPIIREFLQAVVSRYEEVFRTPKACPNTVVMSMQS